MILHIGGISRGLIGENFKQNPQRFFSSTIDENASVLVAVCRFKFAQMKTKGLLDPSPEVQRLKILGCNRGNQKTNLSIKNENTINFA